MIFSIIEKGLFLIGAVVAVLPLGIYSFIAEVTVTLLSIRFALIMIKTAYFYFYWHPEEINTTMQWIYQNSGADGMYDCAYDSKATVWYYLYYGAVASLAIYANSWVTVVCIVLGVSLMYAIKWQVSWFLELIIEGIELEDLI